MKLCKELKAEVEGIQQWMIQEKKNQKKDSLIIMKELCKEFVFNTGMLKGALAEGRRKS